MKAIKVKTDEVRSNYIDPTTGEILETEVSIKHHKIIVDDEDSFFWIYSTIYSVVDDLTKTEIKLLFYACMHTQWNENIIGLGKPICEDIKKKVGLSYQTIKDTISSLKSKNVFIAKGSGYYRINPRYFWRGGSNGRLKTMKYVLEVECPECLNSNDIIKANLEENIKFMDEKLKQTI